MPHLEAAKFDAALASHREALVAEWKRDHAAGGDQSGRRPPLPSTGAAFLRWWMPAGTPRRRPARTARGPRWWCMWMCTTRVAQLHLGPLLSAADRRYLSCDATCEVWFERAGVPIGAGRASRVISRRLRRALEYRDRSCAVPGCAATRGLHAHHLWHWEDRDPPANAPTGGGINPSNPNHHPHPTKSSTRADPGRHDIEAQPDGGIRKSVRNTRAGTAW
ncbi:hypothetical protein ACVWWN_005834 [Mycobacterium sp. URHB0021]